MPITPQFRLSQSPTHVVVHISVPHVRVTAESIQVAIVDQGDGDDGEELHFASPPYLLVLRFGRRRRAAPHDDDDDDDASCYRFHESAAQACATYEPTIQNGTVRLSLPKASAGEWKNLDLLGQWTMPQRPQQQSGGVRWLQQVQDNNHKDAVTRGAMANGCSLVDSAEEMVQEAPASSCFANHRHAGAGYGFLRQYHGIYADLTRDGLAKEMLEMPWAEEEDAVWKTAATAAAYRDQRRPMRVAMEGQKFDVDRYLQDLEIRDDYVYQCAMDLQPHWRRQPPQNASSPEAEALHNRLASMTINDNARENETRDSYFTSKERQKLVAIPYPLLPDSISNGQTLRLVAGLVDILFAYVYDHLTTMGDPTVESAWTISTLSATLAWLDDWLDDPQEKVANDTTTTARDLITSVGCSCLRRSLVYPYIRNFDFGRHCLEQVQQIMGHGVRCVIRCLLQVRSILDCSELYYLGNKLWLDPYLAWLQRDAQQIESVLQEQSPNGWPLYSKADLGLDLVELEERFMDGEENGSNDSSDDDDSNDSSQGEVDESSSSSSDDGADDRRHVVSDDLLDNNLGQSILQVASVLDSGRNIEGGPTIGCEHRRKLIEEVE